MRRLCNFKENNEYDLAVHFITGPSQAKLGRTAQQQLLTLNLLPLGEKEILGSPTLVYWIDV